MIHILATAPTLSIAAAAPAGGGLSMLLLPVILIAAMYFLMIRPQKKREKAQQEKRNAMEVGDQIMTIGGILGKVVNIKGDEVTISSSVANSLLTFRKDAISEIIKPEDAAKAAAAAAAGTAQQPERRGLFGFGRRKTDGQ